jgi:predicted GIY-YIG superfamily endonuclease
MVYAEQHSSTASAIAREHQLKRWSREIKALIRDDRTALDWLSHRPSKATTALMWRDLLNRRS